MYDYSGLWFQIISVSGVLIVLGLLPFCFSAYRQKINKNKSSLLICLLAVALALTLAISNIANTKPEKVESFAGTYIDSNRISRGGAMFTHEYTFDGKDSKLKTNFLLDTFSKKKIFPQELIEGKEYRIYYVDTLKGNIIVK